MCMFGGHHPFPCPLCMPSWGKKTSIFMLTWHKFVLKNPRPLCFTNGFFLKMPCLLGIPKNRCPTNIGQGWVFNLLKIFDQGSIDLTLTCQFFLEKNKNHQTRVEIYWSCKAHNHIAFSLSTF